jgi:hypothetical protein
MRTPRLLLTSLFCVAGLGACTDPGDDDPHHEHDLAVAAVDMSRPDLAGTASGDMAGVTQDMTGTGGDMTSPPRDMVTPTGDMAMPTGDMAMTGPKLMGLPTCTITGVTADALFSSPAMASCAMGRCHSTGAGGLTFTSGATLKSSTVGVNSGQAMGMKLVTAGNIDQSYLLYKLVNQQTAAGGRGDLMPKGGSKLPDADLCKFIVWVREGAK